MYRKETAGMEAMMSNDDKKRDDENVTSGKVADDESERPGSGKESAEASERRVDQWEEESFPGSDPPAHY